MIAQFASIYLIYSLLWLIYTTEFYKVIIVFIGIYTVYNKYRGSYGIFYKLKYNSTKFKNYVKNPSTACCICTDDYKNNEDVVSLTCKHIYHESCVKEWINMSSSCPTCRYVL